MGGEVLSSSTTLWLAISGFSIPSLTICTKYFCWHNRACGQIHFVFNKQRCMFSKSNFKLRFLGNKLHVYDKHSAHFSFPLCPHETKKDQRLSQTMLALLSSLQLLLSGCVLPAASVTFLHSLSFVWAAGSLDNQLWVRSPGFHVRVIFLCVTLGAVT